MECINCVDAALTQSMRSKRINIESLDQHDNQLLPILVENVRIIEIWYLYMR